MPVPAVVLPVAWAVITMLHLMNTQRRNEVSRRRLRHIIKLVDFHKICRFWSPSTFESASENAPFGGRCGGLDHPPRSWKEMGHTTLRGYVQNGEVGPRGGIGTGPK